MVLGGNAVLLFAMSDQAVPSALRLEAGRYALCRCKNSKDCVFCDGSHHGTGQYPYILELKEAATLLLCECGATGDRPFCDGSHRMRVVEGSPPGVRRP